MCGAITYQIYGSGECFGGVVLRQIYGSGECFCCCCFTSKVSIVEKINVFFNKIKYASLSSLSLTYEIAQSCKYHTYHTLSHVITRYHTLIVISLSKKSLHPHFSFLTPACL